MSEFESKSSSIDPLLERDLLLAKRKRSGRNRLFGLLITLPLVIGVVGLAFSATRAVDVVIAPAEAAHDAEVVLAEGFGAVVSGKLYLFAGSGRVAVSSPTYITAQIDVQPDSVGSYLEVELLPQPAEVTFSVRGEAAHLDQTRWLLNDELVATGTQFTSQLAADQYDLQIDHPFYELDQRTLTLARGEALTTTIDLMPVRGTVDLASTPSGAEVLVDGSVVGSANLQLPLRGGEYELTLQLADHGTVRETIRIDRTTPAIERDYRLLANAANLKVAVTPAAGKLLLDGRAVQPNEDLVVSARSEHLLTYQKAGYHTQTRRVTLNPGDTEQLRLELRENIGEVRIQSEPRAQVAIDGRNVGETPLSVQLTAVPHEVTLTKPGYHTETRTVEPNDAQQKLINLTLLTELDYRLQNMPREFDNSAGIRLVRFQPNDTFDMGASRSELGQRANESLRSVRLNRAFYVSQTEITNAQFGQFARSAGAADLPRTNVTWQQAAAFCNWLSEREGLQPVYKFTASRYVGSDIQADGYRLPTEAEWEWLARKANRRKQNRFTWGDDYSVPTGSGNLADESARAQVTQYVAQYTDGFAGVAPVRSFGLEASGLADMIGNVSEWVHDYYQITPLGTVQTDNPSGPEFGEGHVIKGSNWRSGTPTTLRAAYRESASQGRDDLGFRVARYVYGVQ